MADTNKDTNISEIEDDLDEEEPGEVIESAPPLKVGEERQIASLGLKKKLLKQGHGWQSPKFGDEVTVHYVGTLLDGTKFSSSRDKREPFTFKLGHGQVVTGLDDGVVTMTKGEMALFTLPSDLGFGTIGGDKVPPDADIQFEVELLSWIVVVDICKDGGIIKKVLVPGEGDAQPADLDEVAVKYQVMLVDGTVVAKTPDEGVEFYLKDGNFVYSSDLIIDSTRHPRLARAVLSLNPLNNPFVFYRAFLSSIAESFEDHGSTREGKVNRSTSMRAPDLHLFCKRNSSNLNVLADAFGERQIEAQYGFPPIPSNSVLYIDLELVSFKPVIDVTGDSKVLKKILIKGEGSQTANEGAAVTIRYIARLEDGTTFEKKGFNGSQLLQFIVDEEQVISGLDRAAATMKKGEQSIVTVEPDYGYGSTEVKGDLATVPPCSVLVYEVEMIDFTKEKAPWEMNNHEKIEAAEKKKEQGNILFKGGNYQRAAKKYDKAADYVGEEGFFGDDQQKLVKGLRVSCWLNHAACSLKLNSFQEAIKLCSKVLDVEFYNVKALYRRAQAYMEAADLDMSELDIKKALEVDPQNREVKTLHKTLKQLQAESNKRDAKLYTTMFAPKRKNSAVKRLKVEKLEGEKSYGMAIEMEKEALVSNQPSDELALDSC